MKAVPTIIVYYSTLIVTVLNCVNSQESQYCVKPDEYSPDDNFCSNHEVSTKKRFILYDVNPPEGFNLRRDVYLRSAIFVNNLLNKNREYDWRLVLPPWGNLYHWKSRDVGPQTQILWSTFFDLPSLQKYVPVIEMPEFFKEFSVNGKACVIDRVYVLKNDEEMFRTGDFDDKNQLVECDTEYAGRFWGYSNITAKEVKCLIFHGTASGLEQNLYPEIYSSVMFDHMEIALHDFYGSREYWTARRSMRYSHALRAVADDYREKYLNSNDVKDNTEQPLDWTQEKSKRNALGGPYLCVHLRRSDFLIGRTKSVPTIENAAYQLKTKMEEIRLKVIFVATDATEHEYKELKSYLEPEYKVHKYSPTVSDKKIYKDGGIAIIDQIICSKARYFIGTHESTFTFRIQEDREIIGFPSNTTFNRLCGKEDKCRPGGSWKIVWR